MAALAMIFSGSASYCFYTYLTPILVEKLALPEELLSLAFIIFGVAAIISNLTSPLLNKVGGMRNLWIIFVIQTIASVMLTFTMTYFIAGSITIFVLGLLMYMLNTPTQMYYLQISKNTIRALWRSPVRLRLHHIMSALRSVHLPVRIRWICSDWAA